MSAYSQKDSNRAKCVHKYSHALQIRRSGQTLCLRVLGAALFIVLLSACRTQHERPSPDAAPHDTKPQAPRDAKPQAAQRCGQIAAEAGVFSIDPIANVKPDAGPKPAVPRRPQRLTFGIMADSYTLTEETLKLVGQMASTMRYKGAEFIVFLGGIDPTYEGTKQLLRAAAGGPPNRILALPGDRISTEGFRAAMRDLGPQGIDLSIHQIVDTRLLTLVAVPGYYVAHAIAAAEQGCHYRPQDVRALQAPITKTSKPIVLLAHGPPAGRHQSDIDRTFGQENIGDPELAALIEHRDIPFGFFAHVSESTGHAVDRDGQPVPAGKWSTTLFLNVGSIDARGREDLSGRWQRPTAAIVEIENKRARFKLIRGVLELPSKTGR